MDFFFQPLRRENLAKIEVDLNKKMKIMAGPISTMYKNTSTPMTLRLTALLNEIQSKLADCANKHSVHANDMTMSFKKNNTY